MKKSIDLLAIGDLCADLVLSGKDVTPEFGQKEKLVDGYILEMGGSTPILACQAAKLGLNTVLIGKVGRDAFGELIRDTLKEAGVNVRYITKTSGAETGLTVMLNTGSDRAMMTCLGLIDGVARADVPDHLLRSTRHFHIGSYFLIKRVRPDWKEMVRVAKKSGATISLDPNWDPEEKWDSGIREILPDIDIFLPNTNEALGVSGAKDLESAAKELRQYVPIVVVKMAEQGALAFAHGRKFQAPSLKVEVADTVGAGDSFDAGFLWGFLNGKPISECLKIGCICGSRNVTAPGGTRGQIWRKDLKKYLK